MSVYFVVHAIQANFNLVQVFSGELPFRHLHACISVPPNPLSLSLSCINFARWSAQGGSPYNQQSSQIRLNFLEVSSGGAGRRPFWFSASTFRISRTGRPMAQRICHTSQEDCRQVFSCVCFIVTRIRAKLPGESAACLIISEQSKEAIFYSSFLQPP